MTTTSGPDEDDEAQDARWTGRASVPSSTWASGSASVDSASVDPMPGPVYGRASVGGRGAGVGLAPPPAPPTYGGKKKLRPRWGRIALVSLIVIGLIGGGLALWAFLYFENVNNHLKRTDSIDSMVAGSQPRPEKVVSGATNILLLGSDSRDPDQPVDQGGDWRTDTIELMHINADGDKGYLVSFPRDLWIHIPKSKTSQYGNTDAKINAASAWGGVPLVVQTVEEYTGVRIDHLALIDFAGFVRVTDALGGVDMNIEQTVTSIHPPYRVFKKGPNHLSGAEALDYVRQRKQFADGDFARVRHQQEFLKAVLDKAVSKGTVTSVDRLTGFVSSIADAITVDKDFSLIDVAWQFHSLRSSDLTFITCPNSGTGNIDGQSVVLANPARAKGLFGSMTDDTMADWLAQPGNAPK